MSPSTGSRIGHQLRMTAFFQANEPEYSSFNRLSHSQKAMILEESGFLIAEAASDFFTFFLGEDDTIEGGVECVVLEQISMIGLCVTRGLTHIMKRTGVLRDSIQLPPQGTKASPVDTVTMSCAHHIRPSFVNCAMYHECCCI